MDRRSFMELAAAVSASGFATDSGEAGRDLSGHDDLPGHYSGPMVETYHASGYISLPKLTGQIEVQEMGTSVQVLGTEHHEHSRITDVTLDTDLGRFGFTMTPEQTRQFADSLYAALDEDDQ